jgi:hypothetical protein
LTGYGNNGTLVNNPQWINGKIGKALMFNTNLSQGVYVQWDASILPTSGVYNNHDFTVVVWTSLENHGGTNAGWCLWQVYKAGSSPSTIGQNFFFIHPARGDYNADHLGSHYNEFGACGNKVKFKPNWNFVVYRYTNSDRLEKVYHDAINCGSHVISSPYSIDTAPVSNYKLWIGSPSYSGCYYGRYFNGLIDEFRIYNRALSDSEIKALYDATK